MFDDFGGAPIFIERVAEPGEFDRVLVGEQDGVVSGETVTEPVEGRSLLAFRGDGAVRFCAVTRDASDYIIEYKCN